MGEFTRTCEKTAAVLLQLQNTLGDVFISLTKHEHFIEARWQGHLTADDVITASKAYLAFVQQYNCSKLLDDKSNVTGDWTDANAWLEFEWLPQALGAGLRSITHVYADSVVSQLSARDLYQMASPYLQIKNFSDRKYAINWLLSCNISQS